MSHGTWKFVGFVAASIIAVESQATLLLDINFENYTLGALNGQSGGTHSGTWTAPAPGKNVVSSPALPVPGGKAASLSRDSGVNTIASVPLVATNLDTSLPSIYYSFDFYRGDDNDRAQISLWNSNSGNNTGLGAEIQTGANQVLRLVNGGSGATIASSYIVENGKWHRVEFEANGTTDLYDVYVQKEGVAGRLLIGDDVSWSAPNGIVNGFQYYALGLTESSIVVDNLYLETGLAFPVTHRPLVIPEPASVSLLAGMLALARRCRRV